MVLCVPIAQPEAEYRRQILDAIDRCVWYRTARDFRVDVDAVNRGLVIRFEVDRDEDDRAEEIMRKMIANRVELSKLLDGVKP